jgi:hypothetical protein
VTYRRLIFDAGKLAGAGILSGMVCAAAAAACIVSFFLLPALIGLLVEGLSSTAGIVRTALAISLASFSSWLFHLSIGNLALAWIVATTISTIVGGFIGAFLGCLGATFVLQRSRDRLEA